MIPIMCRVTTSPHRHIAGQVAEWLGNLAGNQKVAGSIPGRVKIMLCPRALHPTCLGGNVPVFIVSRSG